MIVVDVETTGIEPSKHSIVSIGAVDFFAPDNQFYEECSIWDGAETTKEALRITGFTEEQVRDKSKMPLRHAIQKFSVWLSTRKYKTIAGHNIAFDRSFLKSSAERYGIHLPLLYRVIDLHTLVYIHHLMRNLTSHVDEQGRTKLNSDVVFNYVGLPPEPMPHNALFGAKIMAEAFSRLTYGKNLLKEFERYPIPNYLQREDSAHR